MDSLTHLVAGALTPLAFRDTPKRAAVIGFGIAVGELPDIDIIFGSSPEALMSLHRGITHALIWQPVLVLIALIPLYLWLHNRGARLWPAPALCGGAPAGGGKSVFGGLCTGPPAPALFAPAGQGLGGFGLGRMYQIALIAVYTHIYLDCMTTFGTQILLPFSGLRVAFPAMFIVDLLLTLPALGLLVCALRQPPDIRPAPHGAGAGYAFYPDRSRFLARIGLCWILFYPLAALGLNALTAALHEEAAQGAPGLVSAVAAPQSGAAQGASDLTFVPAVASAPAGGLRLLTEPFAPFVWKSVLDDGDTWRMGLVSLFRPGEPGVYCSYAKPDARLFAALKRQDPVFGHFEQFSTLMVQWQRPVPALAGYRGPLTEYLFTDLRYIAAPDSLLHKLGRGEPMFVLAARVNESGGLVAWRFLHKATDEDTPWVLLD